MNYIQDLEKIVKINSFTANKEGVDRVGSIFDEWLQSLGYSLELHERSVVGHHRHYRSSFKENQKKLLLLGHLDTVFPPGEFENFHEDERWVYGAGVCDMKGGNIVFVEALRRVFLKFHKIYNIDVLLVSDEETGSDDSKYLTRKIAKEYEYCFVYEAAGKKLELVTGRKGVGTFFIDIFGKAAHAGNHYLDGVDANLEASYKLQNLVKLTDISKETTLNVGKIEGGIGANTISPYAKLIFELRYKTIEEKKRVLESIKDIVERNSVSKTEAKLSGGIQRDVMQTSEKSLQLLKKINQITQQNISYEERGGVSDANIISSEGVITLDGFGPFGDGDHTIKERALKSSFESRIALSEALFEYFILHGEF